MKSGASNLKGYADIIICLTSFHGLSSAALLYQLLSVNTGVVNALIQGLGGTPVNFLQENASWLFHLHYSRGLAVHGMGGNHHLSGLHHLR